MLPPNPQVNLLHKFQWHMYMPSCIAVTAQTTFVHKPILILHSLAQGNSNTNPTENAGNYGTANAFHRKFYETITLTVALDSAATLVISLLSYHASALAFQFHWRKQLQTHCTHQNRKRPRRRSFASPAACMNEYMTVGPTPWNPRRTKSFANLVCLGTLDGNLVSISKFAYYWLTPTILIKGTKFIHNLQ